MPVSLTGVERLVADWLVSLGVSATRDAYRRDLEVFGSWCAANGVPVVAASSNDVVRWREALDVQASPATVARRSDGPLLVGNSATGGGRNRLTRFGADWMLKRVGRAAGLVQPVSATLLRRTYGVG